MCLTITIRPDAGASALAGLRRSASACHGWPPDRIPLFYLPGISREELRDPEEPAN